MEADGKGEGVDAGAAQNGHAPGKAAMNDAAEALREGAEPGAAGAAEKGGEENGVVASNWLKLSLQCELVGHEHAVSCVMFSGDNKLLASCSADKTVRVWESGRSDRWGPSEATAANGNDQNGDGENDSELEERQRDPSMSLSAKVVFEGHTAGVNAVAWDPTSKYIVSASDDKTLIIWSIDKETKVLTLEGHTTYVFCCCFNPQGTIIASGSFDETIRLWNVKDGKCMRELPAHSDPVTSVDFNRDGTMLVSSSHDGMCRVWDSANGHCLKSLIDESCPPVAFARFSPNGKYILVGALDGHIRLWSYINDVKVMKTYKGHTNEKYCVVGDFLMHEPDQLKCIVSGSEDGSIMVWDLNTKETLQCIPGRQASGGGGGMANGSGHSGVVLTVSSDKNYRIASGGFDNLVKIWGR